MKKYLFRPRDSEFYLICWQHPKNLDWIDGCISLQRLFTAKRIELPTHRTSNHVGRSDSGNDLRLWYTAHPWEERILTHYWNHSLTFRLFPQNTLRFSQLYKITLYSEWELIEENEESERLHWAKRRKNQLYSIFFSSFRRIFPRHSKTRTIWTVQIIAQQRMDNWRVKCHADAGDANDSRLKKKWIDGVLMGRSS